MAKKTFFKTLLLCVVTASLFMVGGCAEMGKLTGGIVALPKRLITGGGSLAEAECMPSQPNAPDLCDEFRAAYTAGYRYDTGP